ncbi:MAG: purine-nucleoside phosphorylase [Ignavibacteria bacterium]|nr:purine-nucleoside phosphorylase [Ignavibacteria bacterium]
MGLTGVILGSGLNRFSEKITNPEILLQDDTGFHKRRIIKGTINGKPVVVFEGRSHFYEGYTCGQVFQNVNKALELGVRDLIITNAAGGVNLTFQVSELMLITSHIDLMNRRTFLPNSICYNHTSLNKILTLAKDCNIKLRRGAYAAFSGPSYETKSEINLLRKIGADAVGMSTIPEILYAKQNGINVTGISCITNLLRVSPNGKTEHSEVVDAGERAYPNFSKLLIEIVSNS